MLSFSQLFIFQTVNEKSSNADETDKDEESLFDFLKSLKFQVEIYNNLKKFEVLQKIDERKILAKYFYIFLVQIP